MGDEGFALLIDLFETFITKLFRFIDKVTKNDPGISDKLSLINKTLETHGVIIREVRELLTPRSPSCISLDDTDLEWQ